MQKIDQKIVSYKVVTPDQTPAPAVHLESMHEKMERPEVLLGSTYKIKTPQSDHALYITINDMILNAGTPHETRRPYEIFINSKNMEHYQWITALTRVISAIFRKTGDITFIVDELKGVFDPRGGYYKKGGVFMNSLVAEIGCAIEAHMKVCGLIESPLDERQKAFIAEKKEEFIAKNGNDTSDDGFPKQATNCPKCHVRALVRMDNCEVCLACSDSKCG